MTNAQCQGYAIIALKNLIESEIVELNISTKDACKEFNLEMSRLFDEWEEESAEIKAIKILEGSK